MKIHFTAIGGTGMGSMAGLMAEAGHEVRGSDLAALYPPMSTLLAELGIPVAAGYDARNLDWAPDLVVVGNTCRADHVELAAARARGLRCVSFPELLHDELLVDRHSIVVAGTHGKTTTTSLVAHLLWRAGCQPGYLIGGVPADFGRGFAAGHPPYFVVEGDEYDSAAFDKRPKFVHYAPRTAVLTGVEHDHADIYPTLAHVERAFAMLVERVAPDGRLLVCADSATAVELARAAPCAVEHYRALPAAACERRPVRGDAGKPRWLGVYRPAGSPGGADGGAQLLTLYRDGVEVAPSTAVPLTGAHNMANCVAALAVGVNLGLDPAALIASLQQFGGVARRQQLRGVAAGVAVVDDFAHHPTAIATTLEGLRGAHGSGRLIAVFEPRSGTSRRKVFQQRFADALAVADVAVVAPVFMPDAIPSEQRLDRDRLVADLTARGVEALAPADVDAIVQELARRCGPGDTVVIMSSGGFGGLPARLLEALAGRALADGRASATATGGAAAAAPRR